MTEPDSRSPEEMRADLGELRSDLGKTVDELARRADVPTRARERKDETVRAVRAQVEQTRETVGDRTLIGGAAVAVLAIILLLRRRRKA